MLAEEQRDAFLQQSEAGGKQDQLVLPTFMQTCIIMTIAMYLDKSVLTLLLVGEGIVDISLAFSDPSDKRAGTDLTKCLPMQRTLHRVLRSTIYDVPMQACLSASVRIRSRCSKPEVTPLLITDTCKIS